MKCSRKSLSRILEIENRLLDLKKRREFEKEKIILLKM